MFIINPLEFFFQFEFSSYIFVAFGFLGVFLCLKKLIFRK